MLKSLSDDLATTFLPEGGANRTMARIFDSGDEVRPNQLGDEIANANWSKFVRPPLVTEEAKPGRSKQIFFLFSQLLDIRDRSKDLCQFDV